MKKYIIVTDEGCYSDYGFHLAITDEETKNKIIELFKQLIQKKEQVKPEYDFYDIEDEWDYNVKRLRYVQEVIGENDFNDIEIFEWNWADPKKLIEHYESYLSKIK